jgi:hypothetical protein
VFGKFSDLDKVPANFGCDPEVDQGTNGVFTFFRELHNVYLLNLDCFSILCASSFSLALAFARQRWEFARPMMNDRWKTSLANAAFPSRWRG